MKPEREHSLQLASELKEKEKIRILFVCLGNICRSPAAQGVMEALVAERGVANRFEIDSAGIGGWHVGDLPDKRMRVHASRRGLELTHRARQVRPYDFGEFDMVVAMDDNNVEELLDRARTPEDERKIVRMTDFARHHAGAESVPDPYYEGAEGFELVLDLLEDSCSGLLDALT